MYEGNFILGMNLEIFRRIKNWNYCFYCVDYYEKEGNEKKIETFKVKNLTCK